MRAILAALVLAGSGLIGRGAAAQETGLPAGTAAPVVTVHDLDGQPVDLGRWLGRKPVLLEWWATWCEQCDVLLPRLQAARTELES